MKEEMEEVIVLIFAGIELIFFLLSSTALSF